MEIESFEISEISIVEPIRRWTKPDDLPSHDAQCVYSTEKAITFLGSPYPQLPFIVNIALVQTRYHGGRKHRNFRNFHCRPYTTVDETRRFSQPWRPVRLLHQESYYIFRFSIPTSTFWYKHCFGGNTVPWWSKASKFPKFPFSALYGAGRNRAIFPTVTPSAFIAPRKRLHF